MASYHNLSLTCRLIKHEISSIFRPETQFDFSGIAVLPLYPKSLSEKGCRFLRRIKVCYCVINDPWLGRGPKNLEVNPFEDILSEEIAGLSKVFQAVDKMHFFTGLLAPISDCVFASPVRTLMLAQGLLRAHGMTRFVTHWSTHSATPQTSIWFWKIPRLAHCHRILSIRSAHQEGIFDYGRENPILTAEVLFMFDDLKFAQHLERYPDCAEDEQCAIYNQQLEQKISSEQTCTFSTYFPEMLRRCLRLSSHLMQTLTWS